LAGANQEPVSAGREIADFDLDIRLVGVSEIKITIDLPHAEKSRFC
jgi:hypothetical protein